MRSIELIYTVTNAAIRRWPDVLSVLGINVPNNPRLHGPCPACGGTDRFRFDDQDGRGTFICNQCGAGDGLELVAKVNGCGTTEAARLVADALSIDYRTQERAESASQKKGQAEADCQQRQPTSQQKWSQDELRRRTVFNDHYGKLVEQATNRESAYLQGKGLDDFTFPILPDGRLLLPLVNETGTVTAAQTITSDGGKRLLAGSTKRGAYYAVNTLERPDTVIIAEGLATALSVHLIRPDALVVSAIDAGNLPPVAEVIRYRHPQAQIILAADNDLKPNVPNTGKDTAEKASRSVDGWVALPPTSDKADWNDFHQQNGLEVAALAFNKSLYQPERESVVAQLKAIEGRKQVTKPADPLRAHVESRKDGVFWVVPKVDKENGEIIKNERWLCAPLTVGGTGWSGNEQYIVLQFRRAGANADTTMAISLGDIGEREGWRALKKAGLTITTNGQMKPILADWIQEQNQDRIWNITLSTGWQCGAYIMPSGEVLGLPERPVIFHGRTAATSGYSVKGTAESWRDSVAHLANGNPSMMTGIAAALAAPMIGLTESDGFGIHLYAQSSAGKTTTANAATSLYGNPDDLKLSWYSTALGLANEALAHNDGLMSLDEVGQGSNAKDVSTSVYTLFNGVGKIQGAAEGGNRDLKRWRTVAISTGEMDMETFMTNAGIKVKAGQLVRLLNLPMEKAQTFHQYQNGKDHADALKAAYQANHGAVGRAWIEYLANNKQEAIQAVGAAEARWRSATPDNYGEQVHRVAQRFAILEAALLVGRVITGWDEQECRDAIQHSFYTWVKEFGTGNKEHQQIVAQAEAFLNAYGLSRFAPLPYNPQDLPIPNLAGYRDKGKNNASQTTFYVFPAAFESEIAKGFNAKQFAEVLKNVGMLIPPNTGRGYQRKSPRIDGRQINVYVLQYLSEENQLEK
ncbi:DUF927 domain-containing protein [Edaphovirga cremea]|uniref:DUF927 domain-containing protein n=1 Tax=Edaphovirga cremea TaxID=2267246 RepID=UPI003989A510